MYNEEFSKIYNEYGWDYFSLTMGEAILQYFKENNIKINSHLDMACGTGVLCNYFYKNGIKTNGVDISKHMIKIAKDKNNEIDFFIHDIIDYKTDSKFDLITLTCDALNHILTEEDIKTLFSNIYNLLNNNGYLIFDIYDKEKIEFNKKIVSERNNGIKVYYYITNNNDLINTNVIIKQNDKFIYEQNVTEKIYNIDTIKTLLENANFNIIKVNQKIMNEEQRFKDKLYVICQKI